jgi:hypothetical protein
LKPVRKPVCVIETSNDSPRREKTLSSERETRNMMLTVMKNPANATKIFADTKFFNLPTPSV